MLFILTLISALSHSILPIQAAPPTEPSTVNIPLKCLPRETIVTAIKENGLFPIFVGIVNKNLATEIWITKNDTEKWVSFFTRNDGISCIISGGAPYGFADQEALSQDHKVENKKPKLGL